MFIYTSNDMLKLKIENKMPVNIHWKNNEVLRYKANKAGEGLIENFKNNYKITTVQNYAIHTWSVHITYFEKP